MHPAPALPRRLFLTGTDTDVGKTITAAALCRAHQLRYWKPIQAGTADGTDRERVATLAGVETLPERWRLARACSPHRAAMDEGVVLRVADLDAPPGDRLLVEGAGGWMVPLGPGLWTRDLALRLGLPVVVVCRTGLGTLNHTCLTARTIRADGLKLAGLIAVGDPHPENLADLPGLTGAPLLGWLPRVTDPAADFATLVAAAASIPLDA